MNNNFIKSAFTSKWSRAVVYLLLLSALGALLFTRGVERDVQKHLQVEQESLQPHIPAEFFSGFGEGRMYHCVMNTLVNYGQDDQSSIMEQDIEGTLNVRLLPTDENNAQSSNAQNRNVQSRNAVLAVQFSPIKVNFITNGQPRESEPRALELLGRMFLVTMNHRGGVLDFDFHPATPPHLTSILEGAVRSLQILLPSTRAGEAASGSGAWRTVERDANGECLSYYSAVSNGAIQKRRLSYAPPRSDGSAISIRTSILSSDIRAEVDDGWLVNLYAYEMSEFFTDASSRLGTGENNVTLELLPFTPDKDALIWRETRTPDQIIGWFNHERIVMAAEQQRRESKPVEPPESNMEVLYTMELALRLTPDLTTDHARLAELVAWLNANPDAALLAPGMMLKIEDDALHNYIILALQQSGTPHAQSALCSLLVEPQQSRMNRLRATAAFSFVRNPTEDSIRVLRATADSQEEEYANTALLALGGSAFRVREAESGRYAPLADDLRSRLLATQMKKQPGNERVALLAIGNARDSGFLPQVTPYLKGNDPAYREVAAGTLQHMRGPEVTSLLVERLNADPEVRVRRVAAKSLAEQPADPQTMNFVIGRIDRESDAVVQTELARYLGRAAARDSSARAALDRLWTTSDNRDLLRIVRDVRRGRTP